MKISLFHFGLIANLFFGCSHLENPRNSQIKNESRGIASGSVSLFLISDVVEACADSGLNPKVTTQFKKNLNVDTEFASTVDEFCKNGGEGEVFTAEYDSVALVNARVSMPPAPPASIFLKVTQMSRVNADVNALWSQDADLNLALTHLLALRHRENPLLAFIGEIPVTLLIVAPRNGYFTAAVLNGSAFEDSLRNKGVTTSPLNALFLTKDAALDTIVHEHQHILDDQPGSTIFQAIEDIRRRGTFPNDRFENFGRFMRESHAFITQLAFLRSPEARNKRQWCVPGQEKNACISYEEYVPLRTESLYGKMKMYNGLEISNLGDACFMMDFIDQIFPQADARAKGIMKKNLTKTCDYFKSTQK